MALLAEPYYDCCTLYWVHNITGWLTWKWQTAILQSSNELQYMSGELHIIVWYNVMQFVIGWSQLILVNIIPWSVLCNISCMPIWWNYFQYCIIVATAAQCSNESFGIFWLYWPGTHGQCWVNYARLEKHNTGVTKLIGEQTVNSL